MVLITYSQGGGGLGVEHIARMRTTGFEGGQEDLRPEKLIVKAHLPGQRICRVRKRDDGRI